MWDASQYEAFDFETTGSKPEYALQPWRVAQGAAWITSVSIFKEGDNQPRGGLNVEGYRSVVGWDRHAKIREELREWLAGVIASKRTVVGWNLQFDLQWLFALGLGDLVMQLKCLDGMLLWRHWYIEPEYDMNKGQKKSYGLKEFVKEFLPDHAGYEDDVDFHSEDEAERLKLQTYNDRDTVFTYVGTKYFYEQLAQYPQRLKAALVEADCIPMIARTNFKGMMIDRLVARELGASLDRTAAEQLAKLAPDGVTEEIVRSPLKLSKLLFDQWGLPVLKENVSKKVIDKETGQPKVSRSTDKEVLHELSFIDPRAKELRLYREALNNKTKFAEAPDASAKYNGDLCSHPQAIIFGTYSGRLTYGSKQEFRWVDAKGKNRVTDLQTGFALHQEKRDPKFRNIVVAPDGYDLIEFDAAGQEFRWMAIASGDDTMLTLCLPGEDPHAFMGAQIAQQDYYQFLDRYKAGEKSAKDGRQLGKVGNLSLQYRTSAKKLLVVARLPPYEMPLQLPQAELVWKTYRRSYPGVPQYWERQIAQTKRDGYVETFAGRRVQVVGDWSGKMAWSMGSTSINYRIQGTGADQKYLALSVVKPYLTQIGGYFAWDLHDGIYLWVPSARTERALHDIKYLLDNLPYERAWGFKPPIPLPWDAKRGTSWGNLKEVK